MVQNNQNSFCLTLFTFSPSLFLSFFFTTPTSLNSWFHPSFHHSPLMLFFSFLLALHLLTPLFLPFLSFYFLPTTFLSPLHVPPCFNSSSPFLCLLTFSLFPSILFFSFSLLPSHLPLTFLPLFWKTLLFPLQYVLPCFLYFPPFLFLLDFIFVLDLLLLLHFTFFFFFLT